MASKILGSLNAVPLENSDFSIVDFYSTAISSDILSLIGAKGKNLYTLTKAKFPIPRTIAIPHTNFSTSSNILEIAEYILDQGYFQSKHLIVRSSANAEDSDINSFAGQFKSIKCVANVISLSQALSEVIQSATDSCVLNYTNKFDLGEINLSVLVQEFHFAKFSGVAFSRHPVNPDIKGIYVEWVDGELENLVQGRCSPESLVINSDGASGSFPIAIEEKLAELIFQIKTHLKTDVDIEWLLDHNGFLWILQARPITGLAHKSRISFLLRENIGENYPEVIVPILSSLARRSYYYYFRTLARSFGFKQDQIEQGDAFFRNTFATKNGYPAYNIQSINKLFTQVPFGGLLSKYFCLFIGSNVKTTPQVEKNKKFKAIFSLVRFFNQIIKLLTIVRILFFISRQYFRLKKDVEYHKRQIIINSTNLKNAISSKSISELEKVFADFLRIRCFLWHGPSFADAICMIVGSLLSEETIRKIKLPASEVEKAFIDLLNKIKAEPSSFNLFRKLSPQEILKEISSGNSQVSEEFFKYSKLWGFRRPRELLLTVPDYEEDPESLIQLIKQRLIISNNSNSQSALEPKIKFSWKIRILCKIYAFGATQREIARLSQAKLYNNFRGVLLALDSHLIQKALILNKEDTFFLTLEEIEGILSGTNWNWLELQAVILARKNSYHKNKEILPRFPLACYENFEEQDKSLADSKLRTLDTDRFLQGTGASSGKAIGQAQVITRPEEIKAGVIAIVDHTDPGWVLFLPLLKGLIVERGGILSHAAIISREFSIPTIVGIPDACSLIKNGELLEIDGTSGEVRFL